MSRSSRWIILLILISSSFLMVAPVHAQNVVITVNPATVVGYWTTYVSVTVTVTNNDLIAPFHTITLQLSSTYGWWYGSFTPATVGPLVFGASGVSTLTIPVPGPNDICPGTNSPGPYMMLFTVTGQDTVNPIPVSGASLTVELLGASVPVSVDIASSKPSYMVGETVTLKMDSNVPAEYSLKVKKPDGSTWGQAHGILPATFTKKAAEPLGTYTAELVAYYCGTAQASTTFAVTPDTYDVTVSFAGLPSDATTALYVDGSKVADMKGGDVRVLSYPIGSSHTFKVDQYVDGARGYRYYCASNTWTASATGSNAFNYVTQVHLEVSTDPTGITPVTESGWYAHGSSASIASVPNEVDGSPGTKYRFAEWTVDGTPRAGNGFTVIMDAPHKVVARYDTFYKLTVISDYGDPQGSDYYKAGETATFSVNSPVGFGIQQVFVEWKGDYSSKDSKGSITMDGPKTVTAVWTTSYMQLYMIAGAVVAVAVVAVALMLLARRRVTPAALKPPPPEPEAPPPPPPEETAPPPPSKAPEITRRCTSCGHEIAEGEIFCRECGQKQTD